MDAEAIVLTLYTLACGFGIWRLVCIHKEFDDAN